MKVFRLVFLDASEGSYAGLSAGVCSAPSRKLVILGRKKQKGAVTTFSRSMIL